MDKIAIYPPTTTDDIDDVISLCKEYEQANGHLPLNDQSWIELHGSRDTSTANILIGYVVRNTQSNEIVAYLHLSAHTAGSTIEVVANSALMGSEEIVERLIKRCLSDLEADQYPLYLWVASPDAYLSKVAESLGMSKHRELYQMRKLLSAEAISQAAMRDVENKEGTLSTMGIGCSASKVDRDEIEGAKSSSTRSANSARSDSSNKTIEDASGRILLFRTFQPGRDEASWLTLNNRCFADHPDQANWTIDDLAARENEPWFDPKGFILCEYDGNLAGSCWTKIHSATGPDRQPAGEIYVICTNPEYQGSGIGKLLLQAGLNYFERHSLPVAMLYVESTNESALALYRHHGFSLHSITTQYVINTRPSHLIG